MVLFTMVIMSVMAVAAIEASTDQQRASMATRKSGEAFYVAETGLAVVLAEFNDTTSSLNDSAKALSSGGVLDLGWDTLPNGSSYNAEVIRLNNSGDQEIFMVNVTGRDASGQAGERAVSLMLTVAEGGIGQGYTLGECCTSPVLVRGNIDVKSDAVVSGNDEHPAGWEAAGVCSDSLFNKPGLVIQDADSVDISGSATVEGTPAVAVDGTLADSTFQQFGSLSWDDLKGLADHVIGTPGSGESYDTGDIYPRYNGDGTCDTTHPLNFGSPDPSDACFDYFPIVLVQGDVDLQDGVYAQGIFITDYWTDGVSNFGSELDLEDDVVFNGMVLGKGCVEIQRFANMHGAVFADGIWGNQLCGGDDTFDANNDGQMTWSQCAVDRAFYHSGLRDYATPTIGNDGPTIKFGTRSFAENLR
jgi:hypothetical protein